MPPWSLNWGFSKILYLEYLLVLPLVHESAITLAMASAGARAPPPDSWAPILTSPSTSHFALIDIKLPARRLWWRAWHCESPAFKNSSKFLKKFYHIQTTSHVSVPPLMHWSCLARVRTASHASGLPSTRPDRLSHVRTASYSEQQNRSHVWKFWIVHLI